MIDFSPRVKIEYANMSKMNKIRQWARKNNASVHVSRYARDAYEGYVTVHSPRNEGQSITDAKVAALKAIVGDKSAVY